jgi:hypothetical protein
MTKEDKKARILPALDLAITEATRKGIINDLDLAGIAMAYNLAGYLDNASLTATELGKLSGQLQQILDKYGLSLFGRKEKPEVLEGEDPLDDIRKLNPENTDHTTSSPN